MNIFRHKSSPSLSSQTVRSNILGVTGMSRRAVRALFAERGLFGSLSALTVNEQVAVYAELRLPAGSVPLPVVGAPAPNPWKIAALRAFARSIVQKGECDGVMWKFAASFGISDKVLREVTQALRNAEAVYGIGPRRQQDVKLTTVAPMATEAAALAVAA